MVSNNYNRQPSRGESGRMSSFSTDDRSEIAPTISTSLRCCASSGSVMDHHRLGYRGPRSFVVNSFLTTPLYKATAKVVMQTATLDKALLGTQVFQIYDHTCSRPLLTW